MVNLRPTHSLAKNLGNSQLAFQGKPWWLFRLQFTMQVQVYDYHQLQASVINLNGEWTASSMPKAGSATGLPGNEAHYRQIWSVKWYLLVGFYERSAFSFTVILVNNTIVVVWVLKLVLVDVYPKQFERHCWFEQRHPKAFFWGCDVCIPSHPN